MSELEFLDAAEAREAVAGALLAGASHPDSPEMQFELLRALIWAASQGRASVHIGALLNRAIPISMFLLKSADEHVVRHELGQKLERLSHLGDVVELAGGYWRSAVTRIVPIGSRDALVIGGAPSRIVASHVAGEIFHRGAFRQLASGVNVPSRLFPKEAVREWAGIPQAPLGEWARELMSLSLPRYEEVSDESGFEYYAPDLAKPRSPQFMRWLPSVGRLDGRYLARRTRGLGYPEYRIVEIAEGAVSRAGAVLARGEPRRLMYALDFFANKPVAARCVKTGDRLDVVLRSALPRGEDRLFDALGNVSTNPSRVYERSWAFQRNSDIALQALDGLHIGLTGLGE